MSPGSELRTPAPPPGWVAEQTLLEAIEERGLKRPEKSQLRLWGRRGLIPRARQCWIPGEPGSRSYYPPETIDQLARLLELRSGHRRPLDHLLFELWWEGHPVDIEPLRHFLTTSSWKVVREFEDLRRDYPDPFDLADALSEEGTDQSADRAALSRLIRHRLGRDEADFSSFVWLLAALAAGGKPFEIDDSGYGEEARLEAGERSRREIVEIGMGAGNAEPWLSSPSEFSNIFAELADAGFLDPDAIAETFSHIGEAELARARTTAQDLLALGAFSDAVEVITGKRDVLGFGFLAILFRQRETIKTRVIALSVAYRVMQLSPDNQLQAISETIKDSLEQMNAIAAVIADYPQLREFIPPIEKIVAFETLSEAEQSKIQEELRQAIQANPDIASRLGMQQLD